MQLAAPLLTDQRLVVFDTFDTPNLLFKVISKRCRISSIFNVFIATTLLFFLAFVRFSALTVLPHNLLYRFVQVWDWCSHQLMMADGCVLIKNTNSLYQKLANMS